MSIAAQLSAWAQRWPRFFGSASASAGNSPITFPTTPLVIRAELQLGGEWVDITSGPNGIYYETRIKIKRGRDSESVRAQPSSCKIKLKNPNGWWSPRNTAGPYYGLLGRNVKLRITVDPGDGDHVRFTGYVSKWPQQWTMGDHRWVALEANGILRRLARGKSPLKAPIFRAVMSHTPLGYWTLTEPSGATEAASSVVGGSSMVPSNGAALGGTSDTPDGTPALVVNAGIATGSVTPISFANTNAWMFSFGMKMIQPADDLMLTPVLTFYTDSNDAAKYAIVAPQAGMFPTQLYVYDYTGALVLAGASMDPTVTVAEYDNQWKYYQIAAERDGFDLNLSLYYEGDLVSEWPIPLTSPTIGNAQTVVINPALYDWSSLNLSFQNISYRQPVASDPQSLTQEADAFACYVGESPTARFARLCTEEGIPYVIAETDPDTEAMGPQTLAAIMPLLRECEATNEGVIDETLDGELRLISRSAFWNQSPTMTIDYTSGAIKEGFLPTDDDLNITNEWTITRAGGAERRYTQTTGPLSVNEPDDETDPGVGKYDNSATLSLETDDAAYQHATLRVARGTVNEMRIESMTLHFSSNPELLAAWLQMDLASTSRFDITNTPADMGNLPAQQIMTGYEESIDRLEWTTTLRGGPSSTEQFGILDYYGMTDCGASFLAEDLDTTETDIDLNISDTCWWFHDHGDYRITIRGEEVLVTAVGTPVGSDDSWTQTITVTRSVNGVVLSHPAGTQIFVTEPFIPVL